MKGETRREECCERATVRSTPLLNWRDRRQQQWVYTTDYVVSAYGVCNTILQVYYYYYTFTHLPPLRRVQRFTAPVVRHPFSTGSHVTRMQSISPILVYRTFLQFVCVCEFHVSLRATSLFFFNVSSVRRRRGQSCIARDIVAVVQNRPRIFRGIYVSAYEYSVVVYVRWV